VPLKLFSVMDKKTKRFLKLSDFASQLLARVVLDDSTESIYESGRMDPYARWPRATSGSLGKLLSRRIENFNARTTLPPSDNFKHAGLGADYGLAVLMTRLRSFYTAIPVLSLIHISEPTRLGMISY